MEMEVECVERVRRCIAHRNFFYLGALLGLVVVVLAACAPAKRTVSNSLCQADFRRLDVVTPQSITATGKSNGYGERDKNGDERAFIFPSLPACFDTNDEMLELPAVRIERFFDPRNPFKSQTWEWSGPAGVVSVKVDRQVDESALVSVKHAVRMRLLARHDFTRMQVEFVEWLFQKSHCGIFVDCHRRFNNLDSNLVVLWKGLLAQSTFEGFADKYLSSPRPIRLKYANCKSGCVEVLNDFTMSAVRILPRERLRITWGNNNITYPSSRAPYSRFSSGGGTDVPIIEDQGLRLMPRRSCSMTGSFQAEGRDVAYPYPPTWVSLFGRAFLPVYNEFDLASTFLLKTVNDSTRTYSKPPACPEDTSLKAPANLFLLLPTLYTKGDSGDDQGNVTSFEFEGRTAFDGNADQTLTLLSQQFILVGCDKADPDKVEQEWIAMLGQAYGQTLGKNKSALAPAVSAEPLSPCGGYVSGVLSGKTFVEIREGGLTLNGHLIETTVPHFQPLGQTIRSIGGTSLDIADKSVELWRSTGIDQGLFGSSKVEVLFQGTALPILDQTDVREGDAVYVRSIH